VAVPISVSGDSSAPLTYTVPGSTAFIPRAASANFDGSGASSAFLPTMTWRGQSGQILGRYTAPEVAAGSAAEVSWFPSGRRRIAGAGLTLDYNLGEIGNHIATALGTTSTATVSFQDVQRGDGILVLAMAPSLPSGGANFGFPDSIADSKGNTYDLLAFANFQANPATVNTGVYVQLFWCPASVATLTAGVDTVTATWNEPVFDRVISVWAVHHSGGANQPTELNATPDSSAAVFASSDITLATTGYAPQRDSALFFGLLISAKVGGVGGFGSVAGWTGFFQAESRTYSGAKQSYLVNPQTHGANAYLIAGAVPAPYEDDVGVLPGGVFVAAFNGLAQHYSAGANAWKGGIIFALD
jgi:hypothetical protein